MSIEKFFDGCLVGRDVMREFVPLEVNGVGVRRKCHGVRRFDSNGFPIALDAFEVPKWWEMDNESGEGAASRGPDLEVPFALLNVEDK